MSGSGTTTPLRYLGPAITAWNWATKNSLFLINLFAYSFRHS